MNSYQFESCPGGCCVFVAQVVFAIFLIATPSAGAIFSDVHWNTAIKLSRYEGYKSVSILSYKVPENSLQADFTFQAKTSGDSCSFQKVYVYFQHGSFPLIDLYNETFPEHFYTKRTDAHHVVVQQGANITTFSIARPRPGLWYFVAFLPRETEKNFRIQQKGLNDNCLYGMFIMMQTRGIDNIQEILTDQKHSLLLRRDSLHEQKIFRYKLPRETVSYSVKINNCAIPVTFSDTVVSDSNNTVDSYTVVSVGNSTADNDTDTANDTTTAVPPSSSSSSSSSSFTTTTEDFTSSAKPASSSTAPPPTPSTCPVVMFIREEKPPSGSESEKTVCTGETSCQKDFLSPVMDKWIYIDIALDSNSSVRELSLDLTFDVETCGSLKLLSPNTIHRVNVAMNTTGDHPIALPQSACITMSPLGRFAFSGRAFNVTFLLADASPLPVPAPLYKINIPDYMVLVTSIQIREPIDTGGTLKISLDAGNHALPIGHPQYAIVYICVMKNSLPGGVNTDTCPGGVRLAVNTSAQKDDTVYMPYPESATYYLGFTGHCYLKTSHERVKCSMLPLVDVDIGLSSCVDNSCGEYGVCQHYISDVYLYSACVCFADWRGYGCTDGSEARSRQEELTSVLLLTLTNLFFTPSILVSLYRRYFIEAWVYLFTMFFSGFYHACDASNLVYYCMLDYDVLSFADFVGSITSFWVTLLAMSRIPSKLRWFGHMLGVMGVAVGTEYDRHGIWTFAIPAGLGIVVMFTSWIVQCRKRSSLYPPKRYYLLQLLPGVLLAGTGMILFAFFETEDNYKYTHSAWHVCMSTCIVFLLPVRDKKEPDVIELKEVTMGNHCGEPGSSESSDLLDNLPS